jgi:hypothetical protein
MRAHGSRSAGGVARANSVHDRDMLQQRQFSNSLNCLRLAVSGS